MLIKSTSLFFVAVLIGSAISPTCGGDIISCDSFQNCPDGSVPLTNALTPSPVEFVQEIDPSIFSLEAESLEQLIFKDGFEGKLSGPFLSTVTIGPQGGDFNLSNGIKLSISADAVPEEKTFQFRVIQETEIVLPANILKRMVSAIYVVLRQRRMVTCLINQLV